jgi:hypothetical protein
MPFATKRLSIRGMLAFSDEIGNAPADGDHGLG